MRKICIAILCFYSITTKNKTLKTDTSKTKCTLRACLDIVSFFEKYRNIDIFYQWMLLVSINKISLEKVPFEAITWQKRRHFVARSMFAMFLLSILEKEMLW